MCKNGKERRQPLTYSYKITRKKGKWKRGLSDISISNLRRTTRDVCSIGCHYPFGCHARSRCGPNHGDEVVFSLCDIALATRVWTIKFASWATQNDVGMLMMEGIGNTFGASSAMIWAARACGHVEVIKTTFLGVAISKIVWPNRMQPLDEGL